MVDFHVRGGIEKFLAYYKGKQISKVKLFYYSAHSPLDWKHLLQRHWSLSKRRYYFAVETRPLQLVSPLRRKKISSVGERPDSQTEPDLVEKGCTWGI